MLETIFPDLVFGVLPTGMKKMTLRQLFSKCISKWIITKGAGWEEREKKRAPEPVVLKGAEQ